MKVAVPARAGNLEAPVDPRFGRCPVFVLVDTQDLSYQVLPNEAATQASGAGIAAVQLVANAGAEAVIACHLGPKAFDALTAGGLKIYQFTGGTVKEAIQALQAGQLSEMSAANVPSHFGGPGGGPQGPNPGGWGAREGGIPQPPCAQAAENEIYSKNVSAELKKRLEQLTAELQEVRARITRLNQQLPQKKDNKSE